jgi:hypothetical protein
MLPNNCNALRDRVTEFNELYSLAEGAYKTSQAVTTKIDARIHNEYHYCARGLAEWACLVNSSTCEDDIIGIINKDKHKYTELKLLAKIQRAEHAVRNILNDSIDLVIADARKKLEDMSLIETEHSLSHYIDNVFYISDAIDEISERISGSRSNLGDRIEIYKDILKSKGFKDIKEFCLKSNIYLNKITVDHIILSRRITKERKKFYWQVIFGIFGILGAIVAVLTFITKLPLLFNMFPDIKLFGLGDYFRNLLEVCKS